MTFTFTVKENDTLVDVNTFKKIPIYKILIDFLNLDIDIWINKHIKDYDSHNYLEVLIDFGSTKQFPTFTSIDEEYYEIVLNQLIEGVFYNKLAVNIVRLRARSQNNMPTDSLIQPINSAIDSAKNTLREMQDSVRTLTENLFIEKKSDFHPDLEALELTGTIEYDVQFSKDSLVEFYSMETIDAFCVFAISKLLNIDITIKKCENCKDFFVPSTRSDEIYCDKIHPNGRTCKQMGYENKINSDEVLKEYRRVYKNKNAIKNRNKHSPKAEERWEKWKKDANTKKQLCLDGEISLEEFKEWLKNS